jgi:hypothetical protein
MLKWVYFKVKQSAWVGLYNKHNNMHGTTVKIVNNLTFIHLKYRSLPRLRRHTCWWAAVCACYSASYPFPPISYILLTTSSPFHFHTQKFQLLLLRRAIEDRQRLDWFYATSIFPVSFDGQRLHWFFVVCVIATHYSLPFCFITFSFLHTCNQRKLCQSKDNENIQIA